MARLILQQLPALTALLSSSCCIIQLALNLLSVSCAGFAVFAPYRPILTAITISLLSYNLFTARKKSETWLSFMVSIMLMVSPEIVGWVNQSALAPSTAVKTAYYYRIHLDGLGCEACANRIKNTLASVKWISSTKVYFNNKTAIVETIEINQSNSLVDLIKAIDNKYDAQVLDSWVI